MRGSATEQRTEQTLLTSTGSVWRRILLSATFGLVVLAIVLLVGDVRKILPTLGDFSWELFPIVLVLTAGNYACRFLKWVLYLRWVEAPRLERSHSLAVFLSGFAMSLTPGKVGEWIKAYLVARLGRGAMAPVVPVVAVERLTDGIAMVVLGLVSAAFGIGTWQPLAVLGGVVLLGIWAVRQDRLVRPLLRLASRAPLLRRGASALDAVYAAAKAVLGWRRLVLTCAVSVFSWSLECLGLFVILIGLGLEPSVRLLAVAIFVLSVSSIAGALSLLPGGLGAAEAGIAGLLLLLVPTLTIPQAATATVLIRLGTLWFGVLAGCAALLWLQRRVLPAVSGEAPARAVASPRGGEEGKSGRSR